MKRVNQLLIATAVSLVVVQSVVAAESSEGAADAYRYSNLKIAIRSWNPNDPVQTHRQHSSGSCSHGGAVGVGVGGENGFHANVRCLPGKDRIAAEVKIEPSRSNTTTKSNQSEIDLSDMRSDFIEVSKDDDGSVYFLIIEPEVVEAKKPTKFNVEELAPYDWNFPFSPVVLNDEVYVGRIGMSGGSLAGIEIAGVANLEFSLLPLTDAKPIGRLQSGILTIKTDEYEVAVSGVRNGAAKETREGPFKVWVRQLESSSTSDELQSHFRDQLQELKKRQKDGDIAITDEVIERIQRFVATGRPMLLGSSARDVRKEEISE